MKPGGDVPARSAKGGHFSARGGYVITAGHVRQRPGPRNALGQMKVEMPNPYAIYLHDTTSKGLFGAATRAFTHGSARGADTRSRPANLLTVVRQRTDVAHPLATARRDTTRARLHYAPPHTFTRTN